MNNHNSTDYLAHEAIRSVRQAFTVLCLLLAIPSTIIVALCTNRSSRSYSFNVFLTIIVGVLSNVILQFVWDPIMHIPIPCVLRENPLIPIPGAPAVYYGIWLGVTSFYMPTFMACFIDRHQAVLIPGSRWIVSEYIQFLFEVFLTGVAILFASLLKVTMAPDEETASYIQMLGSDWPLIDTYYPSCFNTTLFAIYAYGLSFGLTMGIVTVVVITLHTFSQLRKSLTMSEKRRNFNKMMTKVLIIQSMVPVVFLVLPLLVVLGAVLPFGFWFNLWSGSLPLSICFLFVSAHSSVHSLILLTMTPIYRRKAVELLKKITGLRLPSILRRKEVVEPTHSSRQF